MDIICACSIRDSCALKKIVINFVWLHHVSIYVFKRREPIDRTVSLVSRARPTKGLARETTYTVQRRVCESLCMTISSPVRWSVLLFLT